MKGLEELKVHIEELSGRYLELKKRNIELEDKVSRIEKDLSYLEGKSQELPDTLIKNRQLMNERNKIAEKIDAVLKRIEKVTAA